jgi:hypothetical protein
VNDQRLAGPRRRQPLAMARHLERHARIRHCNSPSPLRDRTDRAVSRFIR